MEITFSKPKKKFKKSGIHFTPDFYWQIIFCVGLLIVIASFALGTYLFMEMNKKFNISPEDVINKDQTISKERLNKALEYFSGRQNKMEEILNTPSSVGDPAS